ncbi:hypothetical protein [Nostoc sp.]|uniref:hypothetical protein n=1 Tax=Nostoc sp. TaxID=1180 RepID=UPI002FF82BCF
MVNFTMIAIAWVGCLVRSQIHSLQTSKIRRVTLESVETRIFHTKTPFTSIKDSSASIKDSSANIKDSSASIKDSSASIKDSLTEFKDSFTSIKDSSASIKDSFFPRVEFNRRTNFSRWCGQLNSRCLLKLQQEPEFSS